MICKLWQVATMINAKRVFYEIHIATTLNMLKIHNYRVLRLIPPQYATLSAHDTISQDRLNRNQRIV